MTNPPPLLQETMNSNLPYLTACPIYPDRDQARVGEILRDVDLTRSLILSHSGYR